MILGKSVFVFFLIALLISGAISLNSAVESTGSIIVSGTVSLVRSNDGMVRQIKIVSGKNEVFVEYDEKSIQLEHMEGKIVQIKGLEKKFIKAESIQITGDSNVVETDSEPGLDHDYDPDYSDNGDNGSNDSIDDQPPDDDSSADSGDWDWSDN